MIVYLGWSLERDMSPKSNLCVAEAQLARNTSM
jgi:hypothetical protein